MSRKLLPVSWVILHMLSFVSKKIITFVHKNLKMSIIKLHISITANFLANFSKERVWSNTWSGKEEDTGRKTRCGAIEAREIAGSDWPKVI